MFLAETEPASRVLAQFAEGDERMKLTEYAKNQLVLKKPEWNSKHDLESIDKIMTGYDHSKLLHLMLEIEKHTQLEGLIAEKISAISISQKDQEHLLKQLISDDEKTWTKAYENLLVFHPYLNFSAEELCQREWPKGTMNRLYGVLGSCSKESIKTLSFQTVQIVKNQTGKSIMFRQNNGGSGFGIVPLREFKCESWKFTRLLLPILAQRDTPAGRKLIEQVAKGHPDILPTREAKALLK